MDPRIEKLKTPDECQAFIRNARSRGREDLAKEALRRLIELSAKAYGAHGSIEHECLEAIYAYEEVLSARSGKRVYAARTWQMIKRHGILGAVERVVSRPDDATGYTALIEMGLERFAFEAVVLRHPEAFSVQTVERAQSRLANLNKDA
jgi:hypothetical protein